MNANRFEQPVPATADEVRAAMQTGSGALDISRLLVGAALNDPDWMAVQDLCLELLASSDQQFAAVAVTCLGHLARIHQTLDLARVLPAMDTARRDARLAGQVDNAYDDLATFMGVERP